MTGMWACDAYGPEGLEHGAWCFLAADLHQRVCRTAAECREVMAGERQRIYRGISELAAAGDEAGVFLEGEFAEPGQILGGGQGSGEEEAGDG